MKIHSGRDLIHSVADESVALDTETVWLLHNAPELLTGSVPYVFWAFCFGWPSISHEELITFPVD